MISTIEKKKVDVAEDGTVTTVTNTSTQKDTMEVQLMITRHEEAARRDEVRLNKLKDTSIDWWFEHCPFMSYHRKNYLYYVNSFKGYVNDKCDPTDDELEKASLTDNIFQMFAAYAPWREFNRVWAVFYSRKVAWLKTNHLDVKSQTQMYDEFIAAVIIFKLLLSTGIDGELEPDTASMVQFSTLDDMEFNETGDHFTGLHFMLHSNDPEDAGKLGIKVHMKGKMFPNDLLWCLAKKLAIERTRIGMNKDADAREKQLISARMTAQEKYGKYAHMSAQEIWDASLSDSE